MKIVSDQDLNLFIGRLGEKHIRSAMVWANTKKFKFFQKLTQFSF